MCRIPIANLAIGLARGQRYFLAQELALAGLFQFMHSHFSESDQALHKNRLLRFSGEKCAKIVLKLWPNCDKSQISVKSTPTPWIFTFYCIFINKYFSKLKKADVFSHQLKKKLNRSHVENIDEMNYQGCGAQFLDELEGNNESLLKPNQF